MTVLEGFNTASGKYCCNIIYLKEIPKGSSWVSIPQAVSTVATTYKISRNIYAKLEVSIPQAVSTVATYHISQSLHDNHQVSIPQAVSTVATAGPRKPVFMELKIRF